MGGFREIAETAYPGPHDMVGHDSGVINGDKRP